MCEHILLNEEDMGFRLVEYIASSLKFYTEGTMLPSCPTVGSSQDSTVINIHLCVVLEKTNFSVTIYTENVFLFSVFLQNCSQNVVVNWALPPL